MTIVLTSIEAEYRRYKALAEAAMAQLSEAELSELTSESGNSVAVIAWHVAGNLASRFSDFLTTDGEKPWRNREGEFAARSPTRNELDQHWQRGWNCLFESLGELTDSDLDRQVVIRTRQFQVHDALHRSLAHVAYHVGQIVFLAKSIRGEKWNYLSIPPGESEAYNKNPKTESAEQHAAALRDSMGGCR